SMRPCNRIRLKTSTLSPTSISSTPLRAGSTETTSYEAPGFDLLVGDSRHRAGRTETRAAQDERGTTCPDRAAVERRLDQVVTGKQNARDALAPCAHAVAAGRTKVHPRPRRALSQHVARRSAAHQRQ